MKKTSIFALTTMAVMLISVFAPVAFATGPTQPPVDTSTLYVGTIAWGPRRADPVRAYDTASGELIFNTYDTLISMGEAVGNQYNPSWDVQEQYWKFSPSLSLNVPVRGEVDMTVPDLGINPIDPVSYWFEPIAVNPPEFRVYPFYHINGWVDNFPDGILGAGDVLYIGEYLVMGDLGSIVTKKTWQVRSFVPGGVLEVFHFYYDFNIRTVGLDGVTPIQFFDNTGAVVDTFDVFDAEYSFKRGLVQDQYGSPMWMYYKPFFDQMNSDYWDTGNPAQAYDLSYLIKDAIEVVSVNPPVLRINVGIAFPDVSFKQIIAQTWGSMVSMQWAQGKGTWNGDLFTDGNANGYPDWFEPFPVGWRHVGAASNPIQAITPVNFAGTGPYHVVTASSPLNLVVLQRNPGYWQGWPAPNRKAFLEFVDIEYIADWATRREAFKAGQLDVAAIPRSNMLELLDPADSQRMTPIPGYPGIKTIKNISPALSEDNLFFTFTVDPASPALYTGSFPDGAPADFMNNVHVRKAFAYAFNHSKYLKEVWLDEAIARQTVDIFGLVPDYYSLPDKNGLGPWTYDKNLAAMEAELKLAMFGGTSVWDAGGFRVNIYYNLGNEPRRLATEFIAASFNELNAASGKNFRAESTGVDWATYLDMMETFAMPVWFMGWLADFADADNWKRPYMHTYGDFAYYQNYSLINSGPTLGPATGLNKDQLIDLAVKTPDGPDRAEMYADLDFIFMADVPDIPVAQGLGRRWQWYWVKGWYYNALYPSQYYYKLYKEAACWADVTGPAPSNLPEGVENMRDIGYIANHFGAKAPNPANVAQPYDIKWAPGTYGTGGADVYGDRKVDMRDVGLAAAHFGDTTGP